MAQIYCLLGNQFVANNWRARYLVNDKMMELRAPAMNDVGLMTSDFAEKTAACYL